MSSRRMAIGVACLLLQVGLASIRADTNEESHAAAEIASEVPQTAIATNTVSSKPRSNEDLNVEDCKRKLEMARYLRNTGSPGAAEPMLVELLNDGVPDPIRQSALLELGAVVHTQNDLARAESIYAQFLTRWPNDLRAPEVILKQGQIFRQMGLNNYALTKFYSVMTAALALKNDKLEYYQHIVLKAQIEIAETHYQMGKFADAAEFFGRLLKQSDPDLNRPQTQFRLIRSLAATGRYDETASQAHDFLSRYPDEPQQPEVRFYLAQALKQEGRNNEALQQVLQLLQEQKARTKDKPEVWAYWQQRAGNEIANQLYREGDYPKALDVYLSLSQLDQSPAWQVPLFYQIGITYERLLQPVKAVETYNRILARESDMGTNATPGLKAVFDMARWRVDFLEWQTKAEAMNRSILPPQLATSSSTNTTDTIQQ